MFEKISEKKKAVDNLISLSKQLKGLVVHSKSSHCELYLNSNLEVQSFDFDYYGGMEYDDLVDDIKYCINKGIKEMSKEIQKKSSEIFTSPKGL